MNALFYGIPLWRWVVGGFGIACGVAAILWVICDVVKYFSDDENN